MSPSLGAVNQNLLSISDYFIVPMHPDYFSNMAIKSLATVLPKWRLWAHSAANSAALKDAAYPFPDVDPKFLGYVVQKFRPRGGAPSRAFQEWIDQLENNVTDTLVPVLEDNNMLLDDEAYNTAGYDVTRPLLQMPDFNSLIARSQEHQVPVFELTAAQLDQQGTVLNATQVSQNNFRGLFSDAADRVIAAINADRT